MARQMTEVELLDYFELNFNLAADARRNGALDDEMAYEAFNILIERDLYRFQLAGSHHIYETEFSPD